MPATTLHISPELNKLFNWNPEYLSPETGATTSTYTRKPTKYDMHLSDDLILKRIKLMPSLARDITGAVDTTLQSLMNRGISLPPCDFAHHFHLAEYRDTDRFKTESRMMNELSVSGHYLQTTAEYCAPIASTLALHPQHDIWTSVLLYSQTPSRTKYAIADGTVKINHNLFKPQTAAHHGVNTSKLQQDIGSDTMQILEKIREELTDLATWEMKSLAAGDWNMIQNILKMTEAESFEWKRCDGCKTHRISGRLPGPDAKVTPWSLPSEPPASEETSDTPSAPDPTGPNQPTGETTRPLIDVTSRFSSGQHIFAIPTIPKHANQSTNTTSSQGGRLMKRGTKRTRLGTPRGDETSGQKEKVVPPRDFIQQAWSEAVHADTTLIVLHTGNYEFIGFRHRQSQTLYLSQLIECPKFRGYGKLHVGIFLVAIQDAMDRMKQLMSDNTTPARYSVCPSPAKSIAIEKKDPGKPKPCIIGKTSVFTGRSRSDNKRQKIKSADTALVVKDADFQIPSKQDDDVSQVNTLQKAHEFAAIMIFTQSEQANDSNMEFPTPFYRWNPITRSANINSQYVKLVVGLRDVILLGTASMIYTARLSINFTDFSAVIVHLIRPSDVSQQQRLKTEYTYYDYLLRCGAKHLVPVVGLFEDPREGNLVLVMAHGGLSLRDRGTKLSLSERNMFLEALAEIHACDVLHGDLQPTNLLVDSAGHVHIIDFKSSYHSDRQEDKDVEIASLREVLQQYE